MDPVTASAAIGGVSQVIGGLMGSSANKRAQKRAHEYYLADLKRSDTIRQQDRQMFIEDRENQFTNLRGAADKAGLNVLSVLGSPSVPMTGSTVQSYAPAINNAPLASIDSMVQGFSTLGEELTGAGAQKREREKLQNELLKIEVEQLRARTQARMVPKQVTRVRQPRMSEGRIPTVPQSVLKTLVPKNVGPLIAGDDVPDLEAATTVSNQNLDVPALRAFGIDWQGSGNFSTGQTQEDALGEGFIPDVMGLPVTVGRIADMVYHTGKFDEKFGTDHVVPGLKKDWEFAKRALGGLSFPSLSPTSPAPRRGRNPVRN